MDYTAWISLTLAAFAIAGFLAMTRRHADLQAAVRELRAGHENVTDLAAKAMKRVGIAAAGPRDAVLVTDADPLPRVLAGMRGNETYSTANRSSALSETDNGQDVLELASLRRQLREEIKESDERARKAFAALTAQLKEITARLEGVDIVQSAHKTDAANSDEALSKRHDENVAATKGAFDVVQQAILALQKRTDAAERVAASAAALTDKIEAASQSVTNVASKAGEIESRLAAAEGNMHMVFEALNMKAHVSDARRLDAAVDKNAAEIIRIAERLQTTERQLALTSNVVDTHHTSISEINTKLANVDRVYEAADLVNRALPTVQENAARATAAADASAEAAAKLSGATGAWEAKLQAVADKATGADVAVIALNKRFEDFAAGANVVARRLQGDVQKEAATRDDLARAVHSSLDRLVSRIDDTQRRNVSATNELSAAVSALRGRLDALPAPVDIPDVAAIQAAADRVAAADALAVNNAEVVQRLLRTTTEQSQLLGATIDTLQNHGANITKLASDIEVESTARASADDKTRTELGGAIDGLSVVMNDMHRLVSGLAKRVDDGITDPRLDPIIAERDAARRRRAQIIATGNVPPAPAPDQPNPNYPPQ